MRRAGGGGWFSGIRRLKNFRRLVANSVQNSEFHWFSVMSKRFQEHQLKSRIVQSAKVLLDYSNRLGSEDFLCNAVEEIEQSDCALDAFDDLADQEPDKAVNVLTSGIDVLFHGYRMHSTKAELARLRDGTGAK